MATSFQSSEVLRVKAPVLRWSISARPNSESRWRSARPTVPALASGARVRQRQLGQVARSRTAAMVAMIAMAVLTHTAQGFTAEVATLPGSAQVSMQAAADEG